MRARRGLYQLQVGSINSRSVNGHLRFGGRITFANVKLTCLLEEACYCFLKPSTAVQSRSLETPEILPNPSPEAFHPGADRFIESLPSHEKSQ